MKINIGIIGFGTVARGFCEILLENANSFHEQFNLDHRIVAVADRSLGTVYNPNGLDTRQLIEHRDRNIPFCQHRVDRDVLDLIEDFHVDVWCELTDTNLRNGSPAIDYIRHALRHSRHVITTNKGPVFLRYRELQELARSRGVQLHVEGTVMAGTPVINLMNGPLAGCRITGVKGILNGTTNFILTEMENGKKYEQALALAQELGYAEADPTGDVEGWDALAKVKILSNIILNEDIDPLSIHREGIQGISHLDVIHAKVGNKRWKLIGSLEVKDGQTKAYVRPELLDLSHPLAAVNGNMNALTISTDILGDITIMGPGAGKKETGFAVMNGLIKISETCQAQVA